MYKYFIESTDTLFNIENFKIDSPLHIKSLDGSYLSCQESNPQVGFSTAIKEITDRQKWLIEKHENQKDIFYIRCLFNRYNHTQYLGCPNRNNNVFLYTTKNNYTKWSITRLRNNIFVIKYAGTKFDIKSVTIVVARYNEDIDWVNAYDDISIIYNKGRAPDSEHKHLITIPNIGREGNTYLYHIIKNYNKLSKRTIFTQGNPFTHNETILFGVDNYEKTLDIQPLGLRYLKEHNKPPKELIDKYKVRTGFGLEYLVVNIDKNINYIKPHWFFDFGISLLQKSYMERFPNSKSLIQSFLNRSKYNHNKSVDCIRFTFCALFSLTKANIQKHAISVYEKLLEELTSYDSQGGVNGYILERLWLFIFED